MALLETDEILQLNDKIDTFVMINPDRDDDDDVDLFVVKPPPAERDPAHRAPIGSIAHLCGPCRGAFEYFSFWINAQQSGDKEAAEKLAPVYLLHASATTLREGETARCHLCVILMANLRVKRLAMRSIDQSHIEMCWQSREAKPAQIHIALTHQGHPRSTQNYWNILKLRLRLSSEFDEALLGVTETSKGMERHSSTGSVQSREHAMQWLSRCQANEDGKHSQCDRLSKDWLPTRLLDVASATATSMLKLATPLDNPDAFAADRRYVTLSHCWGAWGGAELPMLTTENLSDRLRDGLPISLLPQTFKDAVKVAEWFNIRWLWIDSLCIMQDSDEDWQREAVMMYDVYKNALLNISADDSPDARWGCFRDRDPLAVIPMNLNIPGLDNTFWLIQDTHSIFSSVNKSPLAKRGWVFQERQLSPRVLHFTSSELIWECCAEAPYFASETFPGGTPFKTAFDGKPKFQSQTNLNNPGSLAELHATWSAICTEYSTKVFSHARDKLVALSGLAQEFEAVFPNDMYVAGLWRSTLPQSLLWKSSSGSTRLETDDYIAPSWSWASINGPVAPFPTSDSQMYSLVDILSVVSTPVIPSVPTAMITGASIKLRCFLRPVEVRPDYEKKPWYMMAIGGGKQHELIIKDEDGRETARIDNFHSDAFDYSFDVESDENSGPESVSGYFLPLCISPPNDNSRLAVSGLLVEPTGDDGATYRRTGILRVHGSHCPRVKYKIRNTGEEDAWEDLLQILEPTHEKSKKPGIGGKTTESIDDSGVAKEPQTDDDGEIEKKLSESSEFAETEERDQEAVSRKLEELVITPGANEQAERVGQPKVGVDLDSVSALERLYALDSVLNGTELEAKFVRLVPQQITLL